MNSSVPSNNDPLYRRTFHGEGADSPEELEIYSLRTQLRETQAQVFVAQQSHGAAMALLAKAEAALAERPVGFDLLAHLHRQREFSGRTFGPGTRAAGVVAHIRKELIEIEKDPADVIEWIDVVLLALDGAWRAGHSPEAIAEALASKQRRNEARSWPDWRTAAEGQPIEHVRSGE